MNYVLDVHTHTIASGHAYNTMRENGKSSIREGIGAFGDYRACHGNAGDMP